MPADHVSALSAWESFYVIVGSSGGALIGLQFVVITLIADRRQRHQTGALSAFGTPTVVHLTGALLVSTVMSAPWPSLGPLAATLVLGGVSGVVYSAVVIRRALSQTDYEPFWEDWLWYIAMPSVAYVVLAAAPFFLRAHTHVTLFAIAGVALGLLSIGIHNAWDTVTHIVATLPKEGSDHAETKTR